MIGRTYLERGAPVVVLIRWGKGAGPRNVLIRRADGSQVVRPFRGLRLPDDAATEPTRPREEQEAARRTLRRKIRRQRAKARQVQSTPKHEEV